MCSALLQYITELISLFSLGAVQRSTAGNAYRSAYLFF